MMKIAKKSLCILLLSSIIMSLNAMADGPDNIIEILHPNNKQIVILDGDLDPTEGAREYKMSDKDIHLNELKEKELKSVSLLWTPDDMIKTISVTPFKQETDYYCGPATLQQVIYFVEGVYISQGIYADMLGTTQKGTDMTILAEKIKTLTDRDYAYWQITNRLAWQTRLIHGVDTGFPAILDINTSGISEFPYSTASGHYVNISGYKLVAGGSSQFRITDPYGVAFGNRWYTIDSLFKANTQHWRRAIIW